MEPAASQRLLDRMADALSKVGNPVVSATERAVVQTASMPALSHLTGWLADRHAPGPVLRTFIKAYCRTYNVDLTQVAEPMRAFRTFNAFFTRELEEGARPVDAAADVAVCPADARLQTVGRVPVNGQLEQIKGRTYRIGALLGDEGEAGKYRDGVHATLYLSPRDYHRVHSPVDGVIHSWRHIPGRLFPVNGLAVRHVDGLFTVNERVVVNLESERFGPVALVMVGASNVGRITLSFPHDTQAWNRSTPTLSVPETPLSIGRGDELGQFNLGSTVVLLAADSKLRLADVLEGEHLLMGQPLWSDSRAS